MIGDMFDNGSVSVFVPDGWCAFQGMDSDRNVNLRRVYVYKNAEHELDMFSRAGITLCFYGKREIYLTSRNFYSDVCDITPFTLGEYEWTGYTCTSLGYPYTVLEAEKDGRHIQVMILEKNGEYSISPDDEDVHSIIESISFRE